MVNPSPDFFKQLSPQDQMRVLLMSLEGNLHNWNEGVLGDQQFGTRVARFISECQMLVPAVSMEEWEPVCVNCKDKGCDFCGPDTEQDTTETENPFRKAR